MSKAVSTRQLNARQAQRRWLRPWGNHAFNQRGTMSSEFVPFEVARPISGEGLAFDLCTALPHVRDPAVASRLAETVTRELRKLRVSNRRFAEIGLANGLVIEVDLHD